MFPWVALVGGAASAGLLAACGLALPRVLRGVALSVAALSAGISGLGLVSVASTATDAFATIAGALLSSAGVAAGWVLGAGILQSLPPARRPPMAPASGIAEDPRTAVILLADVEPSRYSILHTAAAIRDLEEADAASVPVMFVPFFFAAQRTRYASLAGVSPARDAVRSLTGRLGALLGSEEFTEPVAAFCDGDDTLRDVLAATAGRGHRSVVVARLGVAEGRAFAEALNDALAAGSPARDIDTSQTAALWASDDIARLVANRTLTACKGAEPSTGVVLIAHGQPPAWESTWPDFDVQETAFVQRVRECLIEGGVSPANVRVAWAGWREPDVAEATRHVAALGSERVLVVPACDPVECLDTLMDLPQAVRMARVDVPTKVLTAWGDAPEVAEALADAVRSAREDGAPA